MARSLQLSKAAPAEVRCQNTATFSEPFQNKLQTIRCSFRSLAYAATWYLPRSRKLFLWGFETATWQVLSAV